MNIIGAQTCGDAMLANSEYLRTLSCVKQKFPIITKCGCPTNTSGVKAVVYSLTHMEKVTVCYALVSLVTTSAVRCSVPSYIFIRFDNLKNFFFKGIRKQEMVFMWHSWLNAWLSGWGIREQGRWSKSNNPWVESLIERGNLSCFAKVWASKNLLEARLSKKVVFGEGAS